MNHCRAPLRVSWSFAQFRATLACSEVPGWQNETAAGTVTALLRIGCLRFSFWITGQSHEDVRHSEARFLVLMERAVGAQLHLPPEWLQLSCMEGWRMDSVASVVCGDPGQLTLGRKRTRP